MTISYYVSYLYLRHIVIISDVVQLTESHDVVVLQVVISVETFEEYLEGMETPVYNFYLLPRLIFQSTIKLSPEDLTTKSQDKPVSLDLLSFSWLFLL